MTTKKLIDELTRLRDQNPYQFRDDVFDSVVFRLKALDAIVEKHHENV